MNDDPGAIIVFPDETFGLAGILVSEETRSLQDQALAPE
jgi:hypothetical protein